VPYIRGTPIEIKPTKKGNNTNGLPLINKLAAQNQHNYDAGIDKREKRQSVRKHNSWSLRN